jgi:hypothetical protein
MFSPENEIRGVINLSTENCSFRTVIVLIQSSNTEQLEQQVSFPKQTLVTRNVFNLLQNTTLALIPKRRLDHLLIYEILYYYPSEFSFQLMPKWGE